MLWRFTDVIGMLMALNPVCLHAAKHSVMGQERNTTGEGWAAEREVVLPPCKEGPMPFRCGNCKEGGIVVPVTCPGPRCCYKCSTRHRLLLPAPWQVREGHEASSDSFPTRRNSFTKSSRIQVVADLTSCLGIFVPTQPKLAYTMEFGTYLSSHAVIALSLTAGLQLPSKCHESQLVVLNSVPIVGPTTCLSVSASQDRRTNSDIASITSLN
jgi:hypothetical protein